MALALLATSFLAFDMVITFPEEQRSRIRRLAKINLLLAAACLIAAIVSF
jgi:cytochrome c oxidase assembly factor CtaG